MGGKKIDDCFSLSDWQGIRLLQWSVIGSARERTGYRIVPN